MFNFINTNNTYCIDKAMQYISLVHPLLHDYKNLDKQSGYSDEETQYYAKKYKYLKERGFDSDVSVNIFEKIKGYSIEFQIINARQIVFETTDACNLKCKYCGYGELYDDYDIRRNKKLNFSKIQPFIQYLVQLWEKNNSLSLKPTTISFYGGEPLLNMPFIRTTVDYFKQLNIPNRRFNFGMTTNAVLLKDNMDFLVENKFQLLLSLDGNQYNQSYRINHSGINSFDTIIANIDKLKCDYPVYFEKFVEFNSVLHNRNSVSEIREFIYKRYNKIPTIGELNNMGIKKEMLQTFNELYKNTMESLNQVESNLEIENELFLNIPDLKILSIFLRQYSPFFPKSYLRLLTNKKNKYLPTGTCFPFSKKIYITVNGKILPCERIGHQFALGSIKKNSLVLDYETIASTYNIFYEKLQKQCSTCYKAESCVQCIFNIDNIQGERPVCYGYLNKNMFANYFTKQMDYLEKHPAVFQKIINEADFE
jgi:uncharacterized protein